MKETIFFLAFLGGFWILMLVLGTLTGHFDKMTRDSTKNKHEWYNSQQRVSMIPLKWLFYVVNSPVLFPVRGLVVSLTFILIFIFTD